MANSTLSEAPTRAPSTTLIGFTEPRIFTPPLRPLTPATSLGFAAVEFSRDVLGIEPLPWQEWLLQHILELREDGSLRFRTVVILVARQSGKSTIGVVLSLFFMYVLARDLVIGTAQDLDVAEEIWATAVELVESIPELDEMKDRVVRVNGKKALELRTGERYKVKAANRRAGRGLSGDLILLDELREHQSWDAWAAITKTTIARAFALIVAFSNAGDLTSVVLRHLRRLAHMALGDPDGLEAKPETIEPDEEVDDVDLGIFEWSAAPGCGLWDRAGWQQANPALGHLITERVLVSAARTDPEWVFRCENMCQWPDSASDGPFPSGSWESGWATESDLPGEAEVVLSVDVSWDRSYSAIALAGRREDDLIWTELAAYRAGTDWIVPWLTSPDRQERVRRAKVVVQANGAPVSSLIVAMRDADVDVEEWKGSDLTAATGLLYDAVRDSTFRHAPWPALDVAAQTAAARVMTTGGFVWDRRRSPNDAAPLIAITAAHWYVSSHVMNYDPLAYIF